LLLGKLCDIIQKKLGERYQIRFISIVQANFNSSTPLCSTYIQYNAFCTYSIMENCLCVSKIIQEAHKTDTEIRDSCQLGRIAGPTYVERKDICDLC
jgi:hypothetical protein